MSFIKTVSEDSATGLAAELQGRDRAALGYVPNYAKLFTLRPEVYEAWAKLNGAVKKSMDRRRYELGRWRLLRRCDRATAPWRTVAVWPSGFCQPIK
jgi:hypothetical protein